MVDDYILRKFYKELPRVAEICQRCGFSVKELAVKMGVSAMTVYRWYEGAHIPLERRVLLREILDRYAHRS